MTVTLDLTAANNATWSHEPVQLLDGNIPAALPEGSKVKMQLRPTADSVIVALELTRDNGRLILTDHNTSTFKIEVPAEDMKALPAGTFAYDIVIEYPSTRVRRPIAGTVTIVQGVTR